MKNNTKSIVGTSFFTGVILMTVIMYIMTGSHSSYSSSMEMLSKHGMVTIIDGTLYYAADSDVTRMELQALAKMSDVYAIELDIIELNDLDFNDEN